MPFLLTNFEPIGGQAKAAASPSVWSYKTPDTLAQVRASGYFNSVAGILRAGDILIVGTGSLTAPNMAMLQVAAVTAGVVTTRTLQYGGSGATPVLALALTLTPLAQANTDFTAEVPTGANILRATTVTTVAYTGTTATLQLGSTSGGAELVAAVSIKAAARVSHTLVEPTFNFGTGTLFARLVQTGPTAVGAATCIVEYALPS